MCRGHYSEYRDYNKWSGAGKKRRRLRKSEGIGSRAEHLPSQAEKENKSVGVNSYNWH